MFAPMNARALALILFGAIAVSGSACRGRAAVKPVAVAEATTSTSAPSTTELASSSLLTGPGVVPGTVVKSVDTSSQLIALTFDDGPSSNLQSILDALSRADARATFFVVGKRCEGHEDLLRDIAASGSELASHSWDHQEVDADSSTSEVVRSLIRTQVYLADAGCVPPTLFRPPAGHYDERLDGITAELGLATALWDIRSGDTDTDSSGKVVDEVMSQAHPGGIVLMHETSQATVDALPRVIDELRARGYRLVTVSELLAAGPAETVSP